MNKDQLITKQQLEIEDLKQQVKEMVDDFQTIHNMLYCVGAPLNDNLLGFNKEQSKVLFNIGDIANYHLSSEL